MQRRMSRTHVKRRISRRGPRCSVFARLVIRGRIACRQLSKTQNDTVNARHVAFRPAHFRNVITSVLSQSCRRPHIVSPVFASRFAAEFCGKFTIPLTDATHRRMNRYSSPCSNRNFNSFRSLTPCAGNWFADHNE